MSCDTGEELSRVTVTSPDFALSLVGLQASWPLESAVTLSSWAPPPPPPPPPVPPPPPAAGAGVAAVSVLSPPPPQADSTSDAARRASTGRMTFFTGISLLGRWAGRTLCGRLNGR